MRPYIFKLMDAAQDEAAHFSTWVKARGLAADDWITLSGRDSNGDKHGGARVLLDDSGAIVYGLGGGHEGKKLSEAFSEIRKKQDVRGQGSLFNFRADKRRDKKEDGGKLEREREALKERGKEIENRRKEQAIKNAEVGKSRFTQAKKEEASKKPEKTLANLRGEKRANAVAAYINEQGHNIDQFRSGSFKGYPQYYFPGAGAGGQKQAFIRAAGNEIAAKCDIQDNGGLGVVIVPKNVDRLDANRYAPQPQKATRARAIENMNEAQLNSEIAKATATRDKLRETKEKTLNSISSSMQNAHKNTTLGFGNEDRSKTVNNIISSERNKFLQSGKKLSETEDKLSAAEKRLSSLQRALNDVKGTGQTQREKQEQPQKIAPKTMKWATTQKGEYSGGGYKPQIIKSGDYEIRGSSGYYRVYYNGKQLSTVSKLSEAKNFAENHSAGSV